MIGQILLSPFFCRISPLFQVGDGFRSGWKPLRSRWGSDRVYWQENEGRRMARNGNILLPSFFCQSSGVSGQSAVLLAPARDLTLALSGPPRGDEEPEREPEGGASHPRCIHVGPRVRGAAGTPRKRLEGAFGARFRLRSLAGAGTRKVKRLSEFCTLTSP